MSRATPRIAVRAPASSTWPTTLTSNGMCRPVALCRISSRSVDGTPGLAAISAIRWPGSGNEAMSMKSVNGRPIISPGVQPMTCSVRSL